MYINIYSYIETHNKFIIIILASVIEKEKNENSNICTYMYRNWH